MTPTQPSRAVEAAVQRVCAAYKATHFDNELRGTTLDALRAELARPQVAPVGDVPAGLIACLRGGRQCDEDGSEIIMSRQACCEAADILERLAAILASKPAAGEGK